MPVSDTDWEYLRAIFEAQQMALFVLVEELIDRRLIERASLIDRLSGKCQALPEDDPRSVVLRMILVRVAEGWGAGPNPTHPSRGPQNP